LTFQEAVDSSGRPRYGAAQLIPTKPAYDYGIYTSKAVAQTLPSSFAYPNAGTVQYQSVDQQMNPLSAMSTVNVNGAFDAPVASPTATTYPAGCKVDSSTGLVGCDPDYGLKCLINHASDPQCPATPINGFTDFIGVLNANGASGGYLDYVRSLTPVYTQSTDANGNLVQTAQVSVSVDTRSFIQNGCNALIEQTYYSEQLSQYGGYPVGQYLIADGCDHYGCSGTYFPLLTCGSRYFVPETNGYGVGPYVVGSLYQTIALNGIWGGSTENNYVYGSHSDPLAGFGWNSYTAGSTVYFPVTYKEVTLSPPGYTYGYYDDYGNYTTTTTAPNLSGCYWGAPYDSNWNVCSYDAYPIMPKITSILSTGMQVYGTFNYEAYPHNDAGDNMSWQSWSNLRINSTATFRNTGRVGYQVQSSVDRYFVYPDGTYALINHITTQQVAPTQNYDWTVTLPQGATSQSYTNMIIDPFKGQAVYDWTNDTVNHLPASTYIYVAPLVVSN
jgi:hypothetical protein